MSPQAPFTARVLVTAGLAVLALGLAACGGDDDASAPDTLVPRGDTDGSVAITTVAPASTTTFSPSTLPPPTAAPTMVPVGSVAGSTTSVVAPSTTSLDTCRTAPGAELTIEIREPMPLPYCVRIRTSQSLRIVNLSQVDTAFNIYRGALEDLFQTPELTPGQQWASEAIGGQFEPDTWSLEIDQIADWVGTMIVVEG
jgi:hypothetical protein